MPDADRANQECQGNNMTTYELLAALLLMAVLDGVCPSKAKPAFLLLVSAALYARAGGVGLIVILLTVLVNWAAAICLEKIRRKEKTEHRRGGAGETAGKRAARLRRVVFWFALSADFGLLALLKYLPDLPARLLTALGRPSGFRLVLPLGISFYTFQTAGYLIDVAGGRTAAERNPLRLALFAGYYPQLIQGPISRYADLAPQLGAPRRAGLEDIRRGLIRVLWGLFKKKVVADRTVLLVKTVFAPKAGYGGAVAVLGVLFYSLQQYADFSGGIDMVLGASEMMGIRLPENFRQPYFAVSLADFWRRWHITLGGWMRDYVFYPFALTKPVQKLSKALRKGGRKDLAGTLPAALGNLLVFLLVGIWHGSSSNYIAWGLYNGLILAVSALAAPFFAKKPMTGRRKTLCVLRTFLIVNIGWFFDRSESVGQAFAMLGRVLFDPAFSQLTDGTLGSLGLAWGDAVILAISAAVLLTVSVLRERGADVRGKLLEMPLVPRWALLYALFLSVMLFAVVGKDSGFMYAMY